MTMWDSCGEMEMEKKRKKWNEVACFGKKREKQNSYRHGNLQRPLWEGNQFFQFVQIWLLEKYRCEKENLKSPPFRLRQSSLKDLPSNSRSLLDSRLHSGRV